jgi:hypothetical protein
MTTLKDCLYRTICRHRTTPEGHRRGERHPVEDLPVSQLQTIIFANVDKTKKASFRNPL